ncbi:MAG: cytochrome c-type biosis protein CcmH [Blastocatellia bacterium]|jgi:cytochrome c-type biogenesis protein CcmH|nr:cytochrome c-type biosis protein CcmH [Blastocatellia bacterium]
MLIFWIIVALFILFALWFVLPPLLQKSAADKGDDLRAANVLIYQDQFKEMEADLKNGLVGEEQYRQDKEELERRLLEDVGAPSSDLSSSSTSTRKVAYGVGLAIPIGVVALYFVIGNPNGLTPSLPQMASAAPQQGGPMSSQQIAANVEKLAKKLEQNPNDAQGWLMLARSYLLMERFADAAAAYEHATALNGNDASVWADYAEAAAMANGQSLAGKPTEAINRALQIDPKQQKALDLAGSAAYQAGDYKKAIDYWQKLLTQLPAGSDELKAISEQIAKAKQMAGDKGTK